MTAELTLLDRLDAGLLTRAELEAEMVAEVYAGLHAFCRIPDGYSHCGIDLKQIDVDQLDDEALAQMLVNPPSAIINPQPVHIRVAEFFSMLLAGDKMVCDDNDPLMPTVGAYLYGPPGVGKTHLMAAYGLQVRRLLEEKLTWVKHAIGDAVEQAYERYSELQAERDKFEDGAVEWNVKGGRIDVAPSPDRAFWEVVQTFQNRVREHPYQPTDVLYLGFQELYEICKFHRLRKEAMQAIERARIVFIDDIHPHGDPEQVHLVLHLLERRYELGRGGTFLTTNLDTPALGGGDEMLGNRLLSRCAETLVTFDFTGCTDWRRQMKARRIGLIEDELMARASGRQIDSTSLDALTGYEVDEIDDDL